MSDETALSATAAPSTPAIEVGAAVVHCLELGIVVAVLLVPVGLAGPALGWEVGPGLIAAAASVSLFLAAGFLTWMRCKPLDARVLALRPPEVMHLLFVLLLAFPLTVLAGQVRHAARLALGWGPDDRPAFLDNWDRAERALAGFDWPWVFLLGCLLPAVGKELFFRGFLGRGLVARYGPVLGILLTSVLFGLIHVDPVRVAANTLLGVVLHGVYLATRSFWAAVLLHTLTNGLGFASLRLGLEGRAEAYLPGPVIACAALAGTLIGWAFYRTRTHWVLPDDTVWGPGYVSAEMPPADLGATPTRGPLGLFPAAAITLVLVALSATAFPFLSAWPAPRARALIDEGNTYLADNNIHEAIAAYDEVIALAPEDAQAYSRRGLAYHRLGNHPRALADLDQAIAIDPDLAEAHAVRGQVYHDLGEYADALRDYDEALRLRPDDVDTRHNRSKVHFNRGQMDRALADLTVVLQHAPNLAGALVDRGDVYQRIGEYGKAAADWGQALRVEPDNADAARLLAWLRAACPEEKYRNGPEAIELASRACAQTGERDAGAVAALACAYAACGKFDDAVRWQEKAVRLAGRAREGYHRQLLELYKSHKPYRFPRR